MIAAILQWIALFDKIKANAKVFDQIKGVLAANNIEADTAALDEVIADATRRKALAEREAAGG